MGIGDERDRPVLDKIAEHNRRVNRLGNIDTPAVADSLTNRLLLINKQLDNHLSRLGLILYRLAPQCDEACNAKEVEPNNVMQIIDTIQHKIHRLETLEENIDRLV